LETSISLEAGQWIRKAAKQGVKEAQHELGKTFGRADFEERGYMRSACKYTR
jgi:hypothetical protein